MSKENIPKTIDPFRFADHAFHLRGLLPIEEMSRLGDSLHSKEGEVLVDIQFGVDEQDVRYMQGTYSTQLVLQCKRCMEPYVIEMTGEFMSGLVATFDAADQLPTGYDPIIVNDGILAIADVIEDELILNLPVVPMHPADDCKVKLPLILNKDPVSEDERENPFKVIELLRSKHNSKE